MRNLIRSAWQLVKENRRAYIAINAAYYGLVAVFMIYAAFNQSLQRMLLEQVGAGFTSGPLSLVGAATKIVHTSLVRLMISRLSFGPM